MTLWKTITRLVPFVRPYRLMVWALLALTMVGAVAAQVNAIVLRHTVDTIQHLVEVGQRAQQSIDLLLMITAVLAGKEVVNVAVRYGQSMIGEQLRVQLSGDLLQTAIARILHYNYGYFTEPDNATGKLQVRIDRGAESLTRFVQNIFIDLLPLVANAALALVLMFRANFLVGLVAAIIAPGYFLLSWYQARLLKGLRYSLRRLREARVNGLFNIIESILVIKSFVREDYEREKQEGVRQELVNAQLRMRKTNYTFDALKTFSEQVGVTLIIILTAFLVLNGNMTIGAI
ncbi:MAG: ABC transporter ATP-binding protein, partial [Brachymonas sp.]|nr:ABC transporter ATP-binding protein [Brachymonas sp.]